MLFWSQLPPTASSTASSSLVHEKMNWLAVQVLHDRNTDPCGCKPLMAHVLRVHMHAMWTFSRLDALWSSMHSSGLQQCALSISEASHI